MDVKRKESEATIWYFYVTGLKGLFALGLIWCFMDLTVQQLVVAADFTAVLAVVLFGNFGLADDISIWLLHCGAYDKECSMGWQLFIATAMSIACLVALTVLYVLFRWDKLLWPTFFGIIGLFIGSRFV